MDSTTLVEGKISSGKKLVEILDRNGLMFPVVLWMKLDENNWTLVLAIQNLEQQSRKKLLERIYRIIQENGNPLSLTDIELMDIRNQKIITLKGMIQTGSQIDEIPFFGNFINGHKFPDSIIYRVN